MDREYLKPFRCVGGLMLFIGVFSLVLSMASMPLTGFLGFLLPEESLIQKEIILLLTTIVTLYTYYLGYRIFIKKYQKSFFGIGKVKGDKKKSLIIDLIIIFIIMRFSWIFVTKLLEMLNYTIPEDNEISFALVLYGSILAPIFEEIVFRGWCINLLKRYGKSIAIFVSALAFGLYHANIYQAIPAFIIGILFGYLTIKYESLWPSIVLHIINNSLSAIINLQFENIIYYPLALLAIVGLIILIIKNKSSLKSLKSEWPLLRKLSYKSISLIVFCILYIAVIILDITGFFNI